MNILICWDPTNSLWNFTNNLSLSDLIDAKKNFSIELLLNSSMKDYETVSFTKFSGIKFNPLIALRKRKKKCCGDLKLSFWISKTKMKEYRSFNTQ